MSYHTWMFSLDQLNWDVCQLVWQFGHLWTVPRYWHRFGGDDAAIATCAEEHEDCQAPGSQENPGNESEIRSLQHFLKDNTAMRCHDINATV